ncbi:MAG: hypothetical protein ABIR67_02455 [Gaiellaceae bacterium]
MVLPWAITAAVLVVTAVVAFWPRPVGTEQPPPGRAGTLVWGNAVFSNPLELEAWLRIRGASYATWARRHPAAVKLLTEPPAPRPAPSAPSN